MILKFFGLLIVACTLIGVFLFESSTSATGAFRLLHWPALLLTGCGPIGIIFICSDLREIKETLKFIFRVSVPRLRKEHDAEGKNLQSLSQKYYLHGNKAFDEFLHEQVSPTLKRTVKRLSLRIPFVDVKNFLERERAKSYEKMEQSIHVTNLGLRMSPSVGMLGTILGMIQLLASLKDPSQIGSHMSLALLTTFYGLFFSLVVWTPMVHHLKSLREVELDSYDQVLQWLDLIEARKPIQYLNENESGHSANSGQEKL